MPLRVLALGWVLLLPITAMGDAFYDDFSDPTLDGWHVDASGEGIIEVADGRGRGVEGAHGAVRG